MTRQRLGALAALVVAIGVSMLFALPSSAEEIGREEPAAAAAAQEGGFDPGAPPPAIGEEASLSMSGSRRAAVVLVAVSMVLLLIWVNRQTLLERAGVIPMNGAAPPRAASPTSRVVGVGRFAREREGSPPPL